MTEVPGSCASPTLVSRRTLLASTGAATAAMLLRDLFPGRVFGQDANLAVEAVQLPRMRVAALDDLVSGVPFLFAYPEGAAHSSCFAVKLGAIAGGGVGPQQDVVAFSAVCTHMGGSLDEGFRAEHEACVCPLHITSFDLTRHGMVISGHATESLPQIILELDGDDLFATGIAGLTYGHAATPNAAEE